MNRDFDRVMVMVAIGVLAATIINSLVAPSVAERRIEQQIYDARALRHSFLEPR